MILYCNLLEQVYLFEQVPAWHFNEGKRVTKAPKTHIVDTGLLCALKRINSEKIKKDINLLGALVESYVFCELKRLATWYQEPLTFYHFRDKEKNEVDVVIELTSGEMIAVEVKASATLRTEDFRGLKRLKNLAGDNFIMGLLLYDGDQSVAVDSNIAAAPLGVLWE